jgi:hypothetical protein
VPTTETLFRVTHETSVSRLAAGLCPLSAGSVTRPRRHKSQSLRRGAERARSAKSGRNWAAEERHEIVVIDETASLADGTRAGRGGRPRSGPVSHPDQCGWRACPQADRANIVGDALLERSAVESASFSFARSGVANRERFANLADTPRPTGSVHRVGLQRRKGPSQGDNSVSAERAAACQQDFFAG